MDETKVLKEEIKEPLNPGTFLLMLLMGGCIFCASKNWVFAICFSVLFCNMLGNLCENRLGNAVGSVLTGITGIFWISISDTIAKRIVMAVQRGIQDVSVQKSLIKFFQADIKADDMLLLHAATFFIGLVIISIVWRCLVALIPDSLKLSDMNQVAIISFTVFLRLFLLAVLCSEFLCWGLNKISLPGGIAYLLLLLPFCYVPRALKEAKENVQKHNHPLNSADNKDDPVKAIEIPDLTLADVAGMAQVKEEIFLRMIQPMKNPEEAKKYGIKAGGGVLLYGPPGTGKTYLAKAVAGELKIPFYAVTVADIFSKYVGESEKNIRGIFQELRKNKLSVLFIDELETIFRKRSDDIHEATRKTISILLQELDGISSNNTGILLIGATNTPQLIDEAFLRSGRFDEKIFVGLPDKDARKQILSSHFNDVKFPMEDGLLDDIAASTENFSGADLKGLTQKVKQRAFAIHAKSYTRELFQECLAQIRPASNAELMRQIREWEEKYRG